MFIVFVKINIWKILDNDFMNKGVYVYVIRFGVYMFLIMEIYNLILVVDCLWILLFDIYIIWDNVEVDLGILYI